MKKGRIGILVLCLLLLVGAVVVGVTRSQVPNQFPYWVQVEEEEPALGEMRFLGLREQPDAPHDVLEISIEVAGKDITCGLGYRVEFFHEGQWFQVSPPVASPAITQQIPVGTSTKEYPVPKGLFSPVGAYRLAAPGLGYCRILVEKSGLVKAGD